MERKYRNIDARTLDLKTGTKKFLVKKAENDPDWDELQDLESRANELAPEEQQRYDNLVAKFNTNVPTVPYEEDPTPAEDLPGEDGDEITSLEEMKNTGEGDEFAEQDKALLETYREKYKNDRRSMDQKEINHMRALERQYEIDTEPDIEYSRFREGLDDNGEVLDPISGDLDIDETKRQIYEMSFEDMVGEMRPDVTQFSDMDQEQLKYNEQEQELQDKIELENDQNKIEEYEEQLARAKDELNQKKLEEAELRGRNTGPALDDEGNIIIDPNLVSSPEDVFAKNFGDMRYPQTYLNPYLMDENKMIDYRERQERLKHEYPAINWDNPDLDATKVPTKQPMIYADGTRRALPGDVTDNLVDINIAAGKIKGVTKPFTNEDQAALVENIRKKMQEKDKNGVPLVHSTNPTVEADRIAQWLNKDYGIPEQMAKTYGKSLTDKMMNQRTLPELEAIEREQLLQQTEDEYIAEMERTIDKTTGKPMAADPKEMEKRKLRTQKLLNSLGLPMTLMSISDYLGEISNMRSSDFAIKRSEGYTSEDSPWGKIKYKIDGIAATEAAAASIIRAPLPNHTKELALRILTDRDMKTGEKLPPELQTGFKIINAGGKNKNEKTHPFALSKLQQVQSLLANEALATMDLGVVKDSGDGYNNKDDINQRTENKILMNSFKNLHQSLMEKYKLPSGSVLNYLRNTPQGLRRFHDQLAIDRREARKERGPGSNVGADSFYDYYGSDPTSPAQQQYLKTFRYGPMEAMLALKDPENFPGMQGIDPKSMQQLKNAINSASPQTLKKMFPGNMTIKMPSYNEDGEMTGYENTVMPRATIFEDTNAEKGLKQMIIDEWRNKERRGGYRFPTGKPAKASIFRGSGLALKSISSLSLRELNLRKLKAERVTDFPEDTNKLPFMEALNNIAQGLGEGDFATGLAERSPKAIERKKNQEAEYGVGALYDQIQEGFKDGWPIPEQAMLEAKYWFYDQDLSQVEKLEKLRNLYYERVKAPDKQQVSEDQLNGNRSEVEYVPPTNLPQSVYDDIMKGNSNYKVYKKPEPEAKPTPKTVDISDSRPDKPVPAPAQTKERGRQKIDIGDDSVIPETEVPLDDYGAEIAKTREDMFKGKKPEPEQSTDTVLEENTEGSDYGAEIAKTREEMNKTRNIKTGPDVKVDAGSPMYVQDEPLVEEPIQPEDDEFDKEGLSLSKRIKLSLRKTYLNLRKMAEGEVAEPGGEYSPLLYGPSDDYESARKGWFEAGEDVREQYLRPQDPEFETLRHPLRDLKDKPMTLPDMKEKYQGEKGYFNFDIIDKILDRGYLKSVPYTPPTEEEPTSDPEEVQSAEKPSPPQAEHIGLMDEGVDLLDKLSKERKPSMPGALRILETINAYNTNGVPIRTSEELKDKLTESGANDLVSLKYLYGGNPEGVNYIDFIKTPEGMFDEHDKTDKVKNKNLVDDRAGAISNTLNTGPISDRAWNNLSEEQRDFMEALRNPYKGEKRQGETAHDVYKTLWSTYTSYNPGDPDDPKGDEGESRYDSVQDQHKAMIAAKQASEIMVQMQQAGIDVNSNMSLDELLSSGILDNIDMRFVQRTMPSTSHQAAPFNTAFFQKVLDMAYPGTDHKNRGSLKVLDETAGGAVESINNLNEYLKNPETATTSMTESIDDYNKQIENIDKDIERYQSIPEDKRKWQREEESEPVRPRPGDPKDHRYHDMKLTPSEIRQDVERSKPKADPHFDIDRMIEKSEEQKTKIMRRRDALQEDLDLMKVYTPEKAQSKIDRLKHSLEVLNKQRELLKRDTTEPELWNSEEAKMARSIIGTGIIPVPGMLSGRHWQQDPKKAPGYFNRGPEGEGRPMQSQLFQEMADDNVMKQKRNINRESSKKADTYGPGGPDWTYEFNDGPTPTKDNKERRKHRFPFKNKPSENLANPKDGEQGNLFNNKPGAENMNTLEATIEGITKTADNQMFEIHSYTSKNGAWLTYTLFKKAYSKFKAGDVVVQCGKTAADITTFRRRFGSINEANKMMNETINLALVPLKMSAVYEASNLSLKKQADGGVAGVPTPDESLSDIQTGPASGKGPYKKRGPYDKDMAGNRDGFNRPKNRRKEDSERNVFPFEDQQISNQTSAFGTVGDYAAPIQGEGDTPEGRTYKDQDVPVALNRDQKRPFPNKRKRTNPNESQLTGQEDGLFQEHTVPNKNMQNL